MSVVVSRLIHYTWASAIVRLLCRKLRMWSPLEHRKFSNYSPSAGGGAWVGERVCLIRIHRQRWELASFACTSLIDSDVNNVISSTAQEYGFRARGGCHGTGYIMLWLRYARIMSVWLHGTEQGQGSISAEEVGIWICPHFNKITQIPLVATTTTHYTHLRT